MKTARKQAGETTAADPWVSIRQTAKALGIAEATVMARALRGELTTQTVAGRIFVHRESIDRALAAERIAV